jgi:hypothetical protein
MELHPFDDERIAHFSAHGHNNHFGVLLVYAVEHPQVAEPEFVAS